MVLKYIPKKYPGNTRKHIQKKWYGNISWKNSPEIYPGRLIYPGNIPRKINQHNLPGNIPGNKPRKYTSEIYPGNLPQKST
jgi:hypothetical protein